ncbi:hypothetical protein PM082_007752 [Marasmius tenuissimus]|nr:hypothetical protein PM082_007752 [Marasmius tenuissimus]
MSLKLLSSLLVTATLVAGQILDLTSLLSPITLPPLTTTTTLTTIIEVPSCTPVICPTPTYTGPCVPTATHLQQRATGPPVVTVTEIETVTWTWSCPGPGGCGAATPTPTPCK